MNTGIHGIFGAGAPGLSGMGRLPGQGPTPPAVPPTLHIFPMPGGFDHPGAVPVPASGMDQLMVHYALSPVVPALRPRGMAGIPLGVTIPTTGREARWLRRQTRVEERQARKTMRLEARLDRRASRAASGGGPNVDVTGLVDAGAGLVSDLAAGFTGGGQGGVQAPPSGFVPGQMGQDGGGRPGNRAAVRVVGGLMIVAVVVGIGVAVAQSRKAGNKKASARPASAKPGTTKKRTATKRPVRSTPEAP